MQTTKELKFSKNIYPHIYFNHSLHSASTLRIFFHKSIGDSLLDYDKYTLPDSILHDKKLLKTKNNNLLLVNDQDYTVVILEQESGFRGDANIEILDENIEHIKIFKYHSPLGNIGETCFVIFNLKKGQTINVKTTRTGRRVTEKESYYKVTNNNNNIIIEQFLPSLYDDINMELD